MRATKTTTYPKGPICRSFKPSRFIASGSTRTSAPLRSRSSEGVVKTETGHPGTLLKRVAPNPSRAENYDHQCENMAPETEMDTGGGCPSGSHRTLVGIPARETLDQSKGQRGRTL